MMFRPPVVGVAFVLAVALGSGQARAQTETETETETETRTASSLERTRFFFDLPEAEQARKTHVAGSIVSTSFYFRESAADGAPYYDADAAPLTASPFDRLFTDLRLQLKATNIGGGKWMFRGDVRGRYNTGGTRITENTATSPYEGADVPVQSGAFSGNELDVRELYTQRTGDSTDLAIGRQYVYELAAIKLDGIQLRHRKSDNVTYVAAVGAYPMRGSRDVREDYPTPQPEPMTGEEGGRILPAAGGLALAYRFKKYHGSFGGVGILPLSDDRVEFGGTGTLEKPRVFATANGYWRQSSQLDLFHYSVVDLDGADGAGLTNLSLGVNYQPTHTLRLFAHVNRVDTETLNVHAQTKLDEPDPNGTTAVQNNIEVMRIAAESARAGVSAAFVRNRFEVSVIGALRRRPELQLTPRGTQLDPAVGPAPIVLEEQQAADVTLRVVDRKLAGRYRVALAGTRTFSVGDSNLESNESLIVRVDGSTEILKGQGEVEANVMMVDAEDARRSDTCANLNDLLQCFGTSSVRSFYVGGLAFYRFKPEWFVLGSLTLGYQSMTSADADGAPQDQPRIVSAAAFARIAYRF